MEHRKAVCGAGGEARGGASEVLTTKTPALLRRPTLTDRIEATYEAGQPAASLLNREVDMNVLNGACAVLAITSCATGCATSTPASDPVRVTTNFDDVAGCALLGKVIVADGPDAAKEARAQTAKVGGNVLLRKSDQVWNGNAYQCPAAAH